jgi:CelD/BcsL family acetyltransferase involved in cellulose biosynthesis
LFDKVSDWDFVDLNAIGYDYEIIDIIKNIADGKKIKYLEQISFVKWYLTDINYTGEEYLKNRSKNIRSEIKRRKKKLEELGALDFKVVNDSDEIDKYMDHYYEVYRKSWKKEENVGPTFHRNLAALGVKKGWLRLGFLFLDGVPIAAQFRFVFNGMCLFIKTSYDEYYKKYSPGIILLSEMTKYIIDTDNVEVIDFGRGDENYKKSWANKKKKIKGMLIFNDNLKGNMLAIFFTRILPFYRKHEALIKIKRILSKNVLKIGC